MPPVRSTFEVEHLRVALSAFLNQTIPETALTVGQCSGVYAFYDYDGEPIYVGQTRQNFGARIGRHLTGQRSDAVAKAVLDPFEVRYVEVWLLLGPDRGWVAPRETVDALEWVIHRQLIAASRFGVILNEADPPRSAAVDTVVIPVSVRADVISPEVLAIRSHPDTRLLRRAQTIARLAQVIAEREIRGTGIRRVLLAQAQRLTHMAGQRFDECGGAASVPAESTGGDES